MSSKKTYVDYNELLALPKTNTGKGMHVVSSSRFYLLFLQVIFFPDVTSLVGLELLDAK